MPKLIADLNETWRLTGASYERWEVAQGVTINAAGYGIDEFAYGSDVVVNGTVIANPKNGDNVYAGIRIQGSASSVTIGKSGYVDASRVADGILIADNGGEVVNHGKIEAGESGIFGYKGMDIANYGSIDAKFGIHTAHGNFSLRNDGLLHGDQYAFVGQAGSFSEVVNESKGVISSDLIALKFTDSEAAFVSIVNEGAIKAGQNAISSQTTTIDLVNHGKIIGDVVLGSGTDTVDTRGGRINGQIYGGDGNDTYMVDSAKFKIVETQTGGTYDLIRSTVTFTLPDHVEALQLIGRKNVNALGNGGDNVLTGNAGQNRLVGKGGNDTLYGVEGNDVLTGGSGADVFVFGKNYDRDRITDFEDGVDHLYLLGVTDQQSFDRLKIRQSGDDIVIDLGSGDRLTIEDMRKGDLTLDDLILA